MKIVDYIITFFLFIITSILLLIGETINLLISLISNIFKPPFNNKKEHTSQTDRHT